VEAYPEGGQRHLSAESGLYCRIYTEGLFGIRPTGLRSFRITPHLPVEWSTMALNKVHAFGKNFDVKVTREKGKLRINVMNEGKTVFNKTVREGESVELKL
jgi:cellobiose phosphorylase